jgi:methylated-DNA-[protein]-cysteine S-methyltransferase
MQILSSTRLKREPVPVLRSIFTTVHPSPVGPLTIAATELGVCGLYFEEHKYFSGTDGWHLLPQQVHLTEAVAQLNAYFAGHRSVFDLPLDVAGTAFQSRVWQALRRIDYGTTTTYAAHAQRVGTPKAIRAVGTAIGRNPISIIVPCHRVIGSTGTLNGYAGGLERKRFLLALEQRRTN